jgi:hypothetical protein
MKISNDNTIYSSEKPRKSSSLPLKSSSQLFSLDVSLIDVRVFITLAINIYPRRIRRSSNLGHIFRGKKVRVTGREIRHLPPVPSLLTKKYCNTQDSVPLISLEFCKN